MSPEIDTASSVSVFSNVSRRRLRPLVKGEPAVEFGRRRLHDPTGTEVGTAPWLTALTDLYSAEYRKLVSFATYRLGDQGLAEETVQDVFEGAIKCRHKPADAVAPYVWMSVVNRTNSAWNRRRRVRSKESALTPDLTGKAPRDSDTRMDIDRAISALPDRQRLAIFFFYHLDKSEAEIAVLMGTTVGTVKSQLSKARVKLHEALSSDGVPYHG